MESVGTPIEALPLVGTVDHVVTIEPIEQRR